MVGQLLLAKQQTLAVAESCTGGMLGKLLTDIPGSSAYFKGGVMAYANEVKVKMLGIAAESIETQGAVSSVVAEQMAIGIRDRLDTDWGIGITGVAGPGGGTADKPVGLVYIGLARPDGGVESMKYRLSSHFDRDLIRQMSAQQSLDMLRRRLLK